MEVRQLLDKSITNISGHIAPPNPISMIRLLLKSKKNNFVIGIKKRGSTLVIRFSRNTMVSKVAFRLLKLGTDVNRFSWSDILNKNVHPLKYDPGIYVRLLSEIVNMRSVFAIGERSGASLSWHPMINTSSSPGSPQNAKLLLFSMVMPTIDVPWNTKNADFIHYLACANYRQST